MNIGILQCGQFPIADGYERKTYGDLYATLLAGHGFQFSVWSPVEMDFPPSIKSADGWLLSGSKHGAYEDVPFIPPLEDFIRDVYAADIPMVGICFGHQIMAQALGGQVEKYQGGWSLGRQAYQFEGDTLGMNAWHQDQVVVPPQEATTIASTDFCAHAALAYKGRALSIQPHPEFESDEISLLLDVRKAALPDGAAEQVRSKLNLPLDNAKMANQIAAFFKEAQDG